MKRIRMPTTCLASIVLASIAIGAAAAAERESFDDRYCTTCHGTDGRGNEGVRAPRIAGMESWYLKRQLENYRDGIRGAHPDDIEGLAMQPMAAKLTDASIRDIVEWVGGWNYVPAEHTISGDLKAGRALYQSCATCHGADAEGDEALGAPALAGQNDWYMVTQLRNFLAGYRGAHPRDIHGAQMRAMTMGLNGEDDINNVVAYINSLSD